MATTPIATCPMARLATLTINNMMFIGFASWPLATSHIVGGGSVAISFGVPWRTTPPLPQYSPSVPSRTTTKSMSLPSTMLGASGVGTPG